MTHSSLEIGTDKLRCRAWMGMGGVAAEMENASELRKAGGETGKLSDKV